MTGEDLRIKLTSIEKARYEASPLGTSFSALEKGWPESVVKSKSDFNYDKNHKFFKFCRDFNDFKNMSLDSKYKKMEKFNYLLGRFKEVKTNKKKTDKEAKKERILKYVITLYKNLYDIYKNDYDSKDELSEAKKRRFDHKQIKTIGGDNIKLNLTALPECLNSKNDFNKGTKLIKNIRADINNVEGGSGNMNVFNDLNRLITDINNNNTKKECAIKIVKKVYLI